MLSTFKKSLKLVVDTTDLNCLVGVIQQHACISVTPRKKRGENVNALFRDRIEAGQRLGQALLERHGKKPGTRVLGLPRGGVPVANEVAQALQAPLDVLVVRKLGLPAQKEYAMGAIASGGITYLDDTVIKAMQVSRQSLEAVIEAESIELSRRERAYRNGRKPLDIKKQNVILVDDGLATGATMRAAIAAAKAMKPARIIVAVPVAAAETIEEIRREVDEVISLATPFPFRAVGVWYEYFPQTTDEEVQALVGQAN
ncbi:phosphoribosyltransferase [Alcaligenaceae bacterium]|nr:phosphoribosyltransferase [Alcaligenaceae bacterium]